MDATTIIMIVTALVLGVLAIAILIKAVVVAFHLLAWAAEQGFLGVAAYVAAWVFMFPVMIIICLIGAVFAWKARSS